MRLIKKYYEDLDIDNLEKKAGFNYLNPNFKDIVLKNVIELSFTSLYPNIICGIANSPLYYHASPKFQRELQTFQNTLSYFNKNRYRLKISDPPRYKQLKTDVNSFYSNLQYYHKFLKEKDYASFVTCYLRNFYTHLLKENANIIYIDTDIIYYIDSINLLGFDNPNTQENCEYIMFEGLKKYVMKKEEIVAKGYLKNAQEALDVFKKYIRNEKIESLGL
jgi:DNA polymerase elongation subunit (family B)